MPIYQNLRRYLLLLLFISPAINSIAQDRSWYPTFERFEITPHPAYSGHIKTLRDHLFFGLIWSEKAVRGVSYFRVNGSGIVDSVATDGFFDHDVRNAVIQNIRNTSGKWTLPGGTKETDYCWFIVLWGDSKIAPYDLLAAFSPIGNTSAPAYYLYKRLLSELRESASSSIRASWEGLNRLKDVNYTPEGVIVKPYVKFPPSPVIR